MPSTARSRLAALAATTLAIAGAGAQSAHAAYRTFESPSGNIACVYDSDSYGEPLLSCDLHSAGVNFTMNPYDRPRYFDSQGLYGTRVLRYGSTWKMGSLRCTLRSSGLTCSSSRSGRGFFLSRDDWYRF